MLNFDTLISLFLFLSGLYVYTITLAPTLLEGDAALYQYTPYVLGVTYPTGYPLYILLGKIWLTLFPFGEIAWRMNLFSALCSALSLPFIYGATRRLLGEQSLRVWSSRWAALTTVLTFATLPTFWRWSTEAKIYGLNILLFSGVLYTLALALEKQQQRSDDNLASSSGRSPMLYRTSGLAFYTLPLALPVLLLGLQVSVHSTTLLLMPGLFLFVWLHLRHHLLPKKAFLIYCSLLMIPGLLYFYVPVRAEWLIAQYGRQEAIMRGLLADFYHSGLAGFVRYFTAADFTGGVVTNWGLVPRQLFTFYGPTLLMDEMTRLGVGLGLVGGVGLALMRPRLFWPLFLIYVGPIPFVLAYGQGEQSAFLLPSFLIFSIFSGYTLILIDRLLARRAIPHASSIILPLLFLTLIPTFFLSQIRYNINWLEAKWDWTIYDEWADALAHPLEPGAAVLAHWGDLTSFWYMQYAEGIRPDLRGLYPPTEETVTDYLGNGGDLYIAGPLQGWATGIEERYQLLPWGRLVRIAPRHIDPRTLLPPLAQPVEAIFDHKLQLLGVDYTSQAVSGNDYPVTLAWQALEELPPETTISLRLSQGDTIVAQLDDTLLSGWFPRPTLPTNQYVLGYMPLPIPVGTLPGHYRLQLVVYISYKHPWPMVDGSTLLDLGQVEISPPPAGYRPDLVRGQAGIASYDTLSGYDFEGEIELAGYEYSVARVGQGKGFAVSFLWQAKTKPIDNYTLQVEVIDAAGQVLRSVKQQPMAGQAPTGSWQANQFIRDQVDFVLPANAPVGERALRVQLSWLRPDGSKLKLRRWWLPAGNSLNLDWLEVTEKEERVFEIPDMQYPVEANLENKARLLGYDTELPSDATQPAHFQLSQAKCKAEAQGCHNIHFDFYWQGLNQMDLLYFVFIHLVDAQGQIVSQHDLGPGKRGKQPTTSWLPGEVVTDPVDFILPVDLAPGQYTLRLGMYLPPDGPRLLVLDEAGQAVGDFVEIGTLQVIP